MNQPIEKRQCLSGDLTINWLTNLVATALEIPASQLDKHTHLACYGLDSVATVAIMAAISDGTGREFDETTLLDYPTIFQLARHIGLDTDKNPDTSTVSTGRADIFTLIREDSLLPEDIQPPRGKAAATPAAILLTGANGFLGVHLLDVLTGTTEAQIYCLVRSSKTENAAERIASALAENRINIDDFENRVTILDADIREPYLGLSTETFDHLANTLDSVYHCAADVNWSLDYFSLRNSNVRPVVDLLNLCCLRKKKRFVFISSIGVCYAYYGPATVAEDNSALSLLDGIYLGYAQSKAAAEALCEQACARGLEVTIHRPGLILGNSASGHSNNDDLISRVIKGCILLGCAPDLDWLVDACPVNEVATAVCSLSARHEDSLLVSHLVHSQPRYWRELVLWMNIYGYPVKLMPYSQWAGLLAQEAISSAHPLYPLRPFFLHRIPEAEGLALPEIYEAHRHSEVVATKTRLALAAESMQFSALDSDLFERYFEAFRETGFLPEAPGGASKTSRDIDAVLNKRFFADLSGVIFKDPDPRAINKERLTTSTTDSIITDLASWKFGKPSGLFRYRLRNDFVEQRDSFIKVKPQDRAVLDVAAAVADFCQDGLGALFYRFERQTGLVDCHKRELEVYRQSDPRFRRHSPRPFLLVDDDEKHQWIIAMEAISKSIFMDTSAEAHRWAPEHIINCIDGLAEFQSIWLGREDELARQDVLCNVLTASDMEAAKPMWFALGRHADSFFESAIGDSLEATRNEIIESVFKWWSDLESLSRTLIHNDFNSRNIAILSRQGQPTLCAFDWELAALGLPQRDLAEFLCFALPPDVNKTETARYVEHHRNMLEKASGLSLDSNAWLYGFQLALFDLAINRIPMYALIHRVKPQQFLPRVTQTWYALFEEYGNTNRM